ncbi:MAG: sigma-70 family RNA polymerase sigma factor [Chloroflexi bacterium OHK40]
MYRANQAAGGISTEHDQALMARILDRDEVALAELYDRYHGLVFTIALRITGDRAVAEEVVQDVFFAVWRTVAGFQQGGRPAAWIIGIARHRAIDATRTRTFRARMREQELEWVETGTAGQLPDERLERAVLSAQVRSALASLAPPQREALELAYYGGLSQAEIAGRMGTPIGTAKTRLRLGLLHLRRELEPRC